MAAGGVRELLLRVKMDTKSLNAGVGDVKRQMTLLRAQYKNLAEDASIEDTTGALYANLSAQARAAQNQVGLLQQKVQSLRAALNQATDKGDQSRLTSDLVNAETALANAETTANRLKNTLEGFKLDQFVTDAERTADAILSISTAYDSVIGDAAAKSKEDARETWKDWDAAFANLKKTVNMTAEQEEEMQDVLKSMSYERPKTYEELATLGQYAGQGGVAYEGLRDFIGAMADFSVAVADLPVQSATMNMSQILNVFGLGYDQIWNAASAIVELGNTTATTEAQIIDMSQRISGAGQLAGMTAADVFGLAAGLSALGINAEAGGTATSKLINEFQYAAALGTRVQKIYGEQFEDDAVGFSNWVNSFKRADLAEQANMLGITMSEMKQYASSWVTLQRVSELTGKSTEEWLESWNESAAGTILDFLFSLSELSDDNSADAVAFLNSIGLTGARMSDMLLRGANSAETLRATIARSNAAYEEGTALQEEAAQKYATQRSQDVMNENRQRAVEASVGEYVNLIEAPFESLFARMKERFETEMPSWVKAGVAGTQEVLSLLGQGLNFAGSTAQSIYFVGKGIQSFKELQQSGSLGKLGEGFAKVGSGLKTAAPYLLAGAAAYGLYELLDALREAAVDTRAISDGLKNLEINIDERSVSATLGAIGEVKAAMEGLQPGGEDRTLENRAALVAAGYGTDEMLGQTLGYRAAQAERNLNAIYDEYAAKMANVQAAMEAAAERGDQEGLDVYQAQLRRYQADMEQDVNDERARYTGQVTDLIAGALERAGQDGRVQQLAKKYNVLNLLTGLADGSIRADGEEYAALYEQVWKGLRSAGIQNPLDKYNGVYLPGNAMYAADKAAATDWQKWLKAYYGVIAKDAETLLSDSGLTTILQAALTSDVTENLDASSISGAYMGLLELMDLRGIAEKGAANASEIGKYSALGLGDGIEENGGMPSEKMNQAVDNMLQSARNMLGIQSPSRVMAEMGLYIDEGLAQGIEENGQLAVDALQRVGAMIEAEALRQAELIRRAMTVVAPAPVWAGGAVMGVAAGSAALAGTTYNQTFNLSGGSAAAKQSVKALAREMVRLSKEDNAGLGMKN